MMVLVPLTFISNVFVDPSTMPGWLQAFADVDPVTATRGLMHGVAVGGEVAIVLTVSAGLVAVFGPATMLLYRRTT